MRTPPRRANSTSFWVPAYWVLPVALCASMGLAIGQPVSDWPIAVGAGEFLLNGHLDVYVHRPHAQMGPLALLVAAVLPSWAYSLFVAAQLLLFLMVVRLYARPRAVSPAMFLGAMVLAWPWAALGVQGHADDALVLSGVAILLAGHRRRTRLWLVLGFLIAVAAKPTAIVLLPLLLLTAPSVFAAGILGGLVIWAPFVLADPSGFLAAGRGFSDVLPGSFLDLLGVEPFSGFPDWVRPIQLASGLALCAWLAIHRGFTAAVLGVFALRTLLEPATFNYYSSTVMALALIVDVQRERRVPALTLLGMSTFILSETYVSAAPTLIGVVRAVALFAIVVSVAWPLRRDNAVVAEDRAAEGTGIWSTVPPAAKDGQAVP